MSRYVYRSLQATEISKLQLIYSLIHRLHLAHIIHSNIYTLSLLRLGHFMTKKTDMT